MNAIEAAGLCRRFGDRLAVDALTLQIPAGSVFGFLGPNGAGKTTTVRLLSALIAPTAGTARVAGHPLVGDPEKIHRAVGLLTESPGLYERLSAQDNLTFFAELHGLSPAEARARAEKALRLFGLWARRADGAVTFSKGMRQKLAIARALLHEPEIVFLDEPTAALDPEAARLVRDAIRTLRAGGRTIFLTTHNLHEADELCDRVGVFSTRLLDVDTPAGLRARLFGRGTRVRVDGAAGPLLPLVRALPFVRDVREDAALGEGALTVRLDDPDAHNPALLAALCGAGARVRWVEPVHATLEEVYLALLSGGAGTARDDAEAPR